MAPVPSTPRHTGRSGINLPSDNTHHPRRANVALWRDRRLGMVVESGAVTEVLPAGAPCWVELATSDDRVMSEFYRALLGWEYRVTVDSSVATERYAIGTKDGFAVAGLYQTTGRSGWIPHVAVSDINACAERVG